jgi:hypothetical protein
MLFSSGTPVFSSNKIDRHDITEILLKVALSTIIPPQSQDVLSYTCVLIRPWSKLYVCINLMVVKRIHVFLISRWANVCIHVVQSHDGLTYKYV